jgi:hypothetical protein
MRRCARVHARAADCRRACYPIAPASFPPQAVFASTPGGIPPEYNIAEQTVTCIQVPQSAQPDGPVGVLVDAYQKRYN